MHFVGYREWLVGGLCHRMGEPENRQDLFVEQLRRTNAQDSGDEPKVEDRNVPFAPFDRADKRAVEPAFVAEFGLGQHFPLAKVAEAEAEVLQEFFIVKVHA
jgi:hypothetical protein